MSGDIEPEVESVIRNVCENHRRRGVLSFDRAVRAILNRYRRGRVDREVMERITTLKVRQIVKQYSQGDAQREHCKKSLCDYFLR